MHKGYIFIKLKGAISDCKGALQGKIHDYELCPNENLDALFSEFNFISRMNKLSRLQGFRLLGEFGVYFFSIPESLYPETKTGLQLERFRHIFYNISKSLNASLGNVDFLLHTWRIFLKDEYNNKRMDMLAYTPMQYKWLETLKKKCIINLGQKQLTQENIFNNASMRCIAIAMNKSSATTGSHNQKPFSWH